MTDITKHVSIKAAIITAVAVGLLLGIFQLGIFVGYRKATFSYNWGDNYHRMFAGPKRGFFQDFQGRGFMNAHGLMGDVLKIDGNTIILRDKDATEKVVIVGPGTTIRRGPEVLQMSDIREGEDIVVIGGPNSQGQIDAKLIRIFPRQ